MSKYNLEKNIGLEQQTMFNELLGQQINVEYVTKEVEEWCTEHNNPLNHSGRSYLQSYCNNSTQELFDKICTYSQIVERKTFGSFLDNLVKKTHNIGENTAGLQLTEYNADKIQDNFLPSVKSDVVKPPTAAPRGKFFQELKRNELYIDIKAQKILEEFIKSKNEELFDKLTTFIGDNSLLVFLAQEASLYANCSNEKQPNYNMNYKAYQEQQKDIEQAAKMEQEQQIIEENHRIKQLVAQYPKTKPVFDKILEEGYTLTHQIVGRIIKPISDYLKSEKNEDEDFAGKLAEGLSLSKLDNRKNNDDGSFGSFVSVDQQGLDKVLEIFSIVQSYKGNDFKLLDTNNQFEKDLNDELDFPSLNVAQANEEFASLAGEASEY